MVKRKQRHREGGPRSLPRLAFRRAGEGCGHGKGADTAEGRVHHCARPREQQTAQSGRHGGESRRAAGKNQDGAAHGDASFDKPAKQGAVEGVRFANASVGGTRHRGSPEGDLQPDTCNGRRRGPARFCRRRRWEAEAVVRDATSPETRP
eukprot:scaffold7381_cov310-Pinguiococcus_pyrenoidosus.AAC.31